MSIGVITLIILIVLFLGGLVVAAIIGLGFYLGWFRIGSGSAAGKAHVTLTVDEDKIRADKNEARASVQNFSHHVTNRATAPTEKSKEPAVAPAKQPQN